MIQFAKAVFSENSLCILEFSILNKMLHKIFGHNTDYMYVIFSFRVFCFAACLPATVLHDLLRDKFLLSYILRSSETVPQDAHTTDLFLFSDCR